MMNVNSSDGLDSCSRLRVSTVYEPTGDVGVHARDPEAGIARHGAAAELDAVLDPRVVLDLLVRAAG